MLEISCSTSHVRCMKRNEPVRRSTDVQHLPKYSFARVEVSCSREGILVWTVVNTGTVHVYGIIFVPLRNNVGAVTALIHFAS